MPVNPTESLLALLSGPSRANDSLEVAASRKKALDEMKRSLGLQAADPRHTFSGALPSDVTSLEEDIAQDPYTGVAAQQDVANIRKKQAEQAMYNSPEATGIRQQQEAQKLRESLAVPEQQGQNALALQQATGQTALQMQREGQDFTRELQGGGGAEGGQTTVRVNPKGQASLTIAPEKLTTEQSRAMGVIGSMEELAPEYERLMKNAYPGIDKNPASFSSLTDMFGAKVGGAIYKAGHVPSPEQDHIDQLTGYFEALVPRMLANGRINREQYEDLKKHAPQLGLSPGANYLRTKYIMDSILPSVKTGLSRAHGAAAAPAGGDPYDDPNWGR